MMETRNFEELSHQFIKVSSDSKIVMQTLIECIDAGFVPNESGITDFNNFMVQLRECQKNIITYFDTHSDILLKPGEPYSIDMYQELYSAGNLARLQQEKENVIQLLNEFQLVYSVAEVFDNALEPFRKDAENLTDEVSNAEDSLLKELIHKVAGIKAFMYLLEYKEKDDNLPEWDIISDVFSAKVYRGLTQNQYLRYSETGKENPAIHISEVDDIDLEPVLLTDNDNKTEASFNVDIIISGNPILEHIPCIPVSPENDLISKMPTSQSSSDPMIFVYDWNRNKKANVSEYKKDMARYIDTSVTLMCIAANFLVVSVKHVQKIASYMNFPDTEQNKYEIEILRQTFTYLCSKGYLVRIRLFENADDYYALTTVGAICLKKQTLNLYIKEKSNISLWEFQDGKVEWDKISVQKLSQWIDRSEALLTYIQFVNEQCDKTERDYIFSTIRKEGQSYLLPLPGSVTYAKAYLIPEQRLLDSEGWLPDDDFIKANSNCWMLIAVSREECISHIFALARTAIPFAHNRIAVISKDDLSTEDVEDKTNLSIKSDESYDKSQREDSKRSLYVTIGTPPLNSDLSINEKEKPTIEKEIEKSDSLSSIQVMEIGTAPCAMIVDAVLEKALTQHPPNCNSTVVGSARKKSEVMLEESIGPEDKDQMMDLIYTLLAEGTAETCIETSSDGGIQALLLTKALSFVENIPEYCSFYRKLLCAMDFPLETRSYQGISVSELFTERRDDGLLIPSLLSALFYHDTEYDFTLYALTEEKQEIFSSDIFADVPALWSVFDKLRSLKTILPVGFSPAILSQFCNEDSKQNLKLSLSNNAKLYQKEPIVKAKISGMPQLILNCFGKDSEFSQCMAIISKNDISQLEFVKLVYSCFTDSVETDNLGCISAQEIELFIDKQWKKSTEHERTKKFNLQYYARKKIEEHIRERLEIMEKWIQLATGSQEITISDSVKIRQELLKALYKTQEQIKALPTAANSKLQAEHNLLLRMVEHVLCELETGIMQKMYNLPSELLRTIWIDPELIRYEDLFEDVNGFEMWRRVLRHITESNTTHQEVLENIRAGKLPYWGDNFGQYSALMKLTEDKTIEKELDSEVLWADSYKRAEGLAKKDEEKFRGDCELAFAYGRIDENKKEAILQMVEERHEIFWNSRNFGRYRAFLDALRNQIQEYAEQVGQEHYRRLHTIQEQMNLTDEPCQMLEIVNQMLENKNFAVAEEYLNRLANGEKDLPESEKKANQEDDSLKYFLEAFDKIYMRCLKNKGGALKNWGGEAINLPSNWSVRYRDSSRRLIQSWPSRKPTDENQLQTLFSELGFQDANVKRDKTSGKHELFVLRSTKTPRNLQDYPHPIGRFGTLKKDIINVVCLFGISSPEEIIRILTNDLHLGENAIVLLDSAFDQLNRRKMAEIFKSKTSEHHSFLLIDQVLLLHLSTIQPSERLPVLLKCTLPYTHYQPFAKDGGTIADEMFSGRKIELQDIISPNGSSLVYGGRQLGKTALLERAQSIVHQPQIKEYAVFVNAQNCDRLTLLKMIVSKLYTLALCSREITTWEGLCRDLEDRFSNRSISRLLLLIDEADFFLEDAKPDYQVLKPLIELKRTTKNEFKFVMAGLHNVARTKMAMQKNGILPQLGKPLCIQPLSPIDARRLIERPLLYLGFRLEHIQQIDLILANTNYYPGILHFFGYTLVQTVSESYKNYYSASKNNPPYDLLDEQLKAILSSEGLNQSIKDKLRLTLDLDIRYKLIASDIASLYYENVGKGTQNQQGYSSETIRNQALLFDVHGLHGLTPEDYNDLLSEMVDMGILWSSTDSGRYRLRRNSFLSTIGDEDRVMVTLSED